MYLRDLAAGLPFDSLAGAVSKGETLVQVLEGKDKTGVEIRLLRK